MILFDDFLRLFFYLLAHRNIPAYSAPIGKNGSLYGYMDISDSHNYIIGSTGSGKSYLLLNQLFHLIIKGEGGALIEPYGGLFYDLSALCMFYEYCRKNLSQVRKYAEKYLGNIQPSLKGLTSSEIAPIIEDRVLMCQTLLQTDLEELFPPLNVYMIDCKKEANNPFRINPFELFEGESVADAVDTMYQSIERHTGQGSSETPELASIMEGIFAYCTVEGLEFRDIHRVLKKLGEYSGQGTKSARPLPKSFFERMHDCEDMTAQISASYFENQLLRFSKPEFIKHTQSTFNRQRFIFNDTVMSFLDTKNTTLNLYSLINSEDERKPFMLFHIPSEKKGGDYLSSYTLSKIEKLIILRNHRQKQLKFFLFIDEFFEIADDIICQNFAKVRQYGLRYTIAHQNLDQLKKEDVTNSRLGMVFKNCKNKIIFHVGGEDADYMAKGCFPVTGEVPQITFSKSHSKSIGEGFSTQTSTSKTEGHAHATNTSETDSLQENHGRSKMSSENLSNSTTISNSRTNSTGTHYNLENGVMESLGSSMNLGTSTSLNRGQSVNRGTNQGTGETSQFGTGKAKTKGETDTINYSQTIGNVEGKSTTIGKTEGVTEHQGKLSLKEEREFIAQRLRMLKSREFYFCTEGLLAYKLRTFDSLNFKIQKSLEIFSEENFYPQLKVFQKKDRLKMVQLLEEKTKELETKESNEGLGNDGFTP